MSSHTLVVMRHAKAEGFGDDDHSRRLTDRGRQAASEVGEWLLARGCAPTHALVSTAARTQQTWAAVATGSGADVEPTLVDGLYSAGPDTALDIIREVAPEAAVLVVVGHNPTMAYLATSLSDDRPDADAFRGVAGGFPPASLAVYDVTVPWADLAEGTVQLTAFHVGQR